MTHFESGALELLEILSSNKESKNSPNNNRSAFESSAPSSITTRSTIDSVEAEELRAQIEILLGLYTADLLPGSYDTWIIEKRERLSQLRLDLLPCAAELAAVAGNFPKAFRLKTRVFTLTP